ncbi:MAG: hypothetical protein K1X85_10265 [Ignavibacteria bacterium]|nr:hypothetical protein [Ignavibacteria bacterium]
MKNKTVSLICILTALLAVIHLSSCGKVPPEKFFGITVLNVNLMSGFAGSGFSRQLESPSVKYSGDGSGTTPMTRREIIEMKTKSFEDNYDDVKGLSESGDGKEVLSSSKALYEFVIPVMKNEYLMLADMYDKGASAEETKAMTDEINEKYSTRFKELYDELIMHGKVYAGKHNIMVNWGD